MKVAVTSRGKELDSEVDPRFGRARFFVLVDTDTGEFQAMDNGQNLNAAQGAGIQAAQNVAALGAEALLTGHCGPNAFRALSAGGIKVFAAVTGTVAEAIEQFKAGTLAPAEDADVQGHWA
ncbi:MAG: NifB/NifX family molybdenum-iron cluster-binding protein [Verrucomicrobia bacterium]|nr:NifB/NifX family molybdenum-iron cluster-binding protein [Verrucomicrobiota bacterium]